MLLCLVDLWKLDGSIFNFKCVRCIYFHFISYRNTRIQTVKILIIRRALKRLISKSVWSGPALFAYVHCYRTQCPRELSNAPEILQFHDCNVTLYTAKHSFVTSLFHQKNLCPKKLPKRATIPHLSTSIYLFSSFVLVFLCVCFFFFLTQ